MKRFNEVPVSVLRKISPTIKENRLTMVLEAVIEKRAKARLFTYQEEFNHLWFLWDQGNNVFYLSKDKGFISPSIKALKELISLEIREMALAQNSPYFSLKGLCKEATLILQEVFQETITGEYDKLFYRYPLSTPPQMKLKGVDFFIINQDLFEEDLLNQDHVYEEIQSMWPSLHQFLEEGFGVAAVVNKEIVCWCTAEYVGISHCGIGIETVEEMQNRGIATNTAARFITLSLQKGFIPNWECWANNLSSVKVAEKLSFELLESSTVLVGTF